MENEEKEELREIAEVMINIRKKIEVAIDCIINGQPIVAKTVLEQAQEIQRRIEFRLNALYGNKNHRPS